MDQHREDFYRRPGIDFTRDRKIPFDTLLHFQISMESGSVSHELPKYFNFNVQVPSLSSFYQQRAKLSDDVFQTLFYSFNRHFSPKSLLKCRYQLPACDGSGFNQTFPKTSSMRKKFKPHCISRVLMCNLKPSDIQELLDEMQPNYSYSTIRKVYLFLHSMVKYGKTEKDLPKTYDPFITVEMPDESAVGIKTKQIETISEEYIGKIKEAALSCKPDGTLNYRYGPAFVFVLNTDLREGELLAISQNGIHKDSEGCMSIHIAETVSNVKNRDMRISKHYTQIITPPKYPRSNRVIPLNQEAQKCLNIMLETYGQHQIWDYLIVCTNTGNFPTSRNIQETLDRILRKCEQTFGFFKAQLRIAAFLTRGKPEGNSGMARAQQYLYHCEHLYAYGL